MVALLAAASVAAHLAITSRSARAAVLIPALALPMAGWGHDPALMILVAVMGTGFCQSMMASAKPVAIFGHAEGAGFAQRDLMRLALPLAPAVTALLVGFALLVWPAQLERMRGGAQEAPASVSAPAPTISATRPAPRPARLPAEPRHPRAMGELQRLQHEVNRALRPVGLRITIR